MSVRIGAIGVGHWHAPRHLDSFVAAGAAVVAVCADEPGAAEQWSRRLGARAYDDHRKLLRDGGLDLVLAMPRHRDGPALLADLTATGLPFVVEKPAATTADDLLPHVLSVEASGQFAAVPFVNRYSAFWSRLRDLCPGPVSTARFRIVNGPPDRYVDDGVAWVLDPEISGGGALRNLGTHTVDAYLAVAQGPVEVVGSAFTNRLHGLAVEEHAVALLRDSAGLIGVVEAGYSRPDADGTDHEWCVAGAGGYLRELHDQLEVITSDSVDVVESPSVMHRYQLFAEDVLRRLAVGAPPPITLRDCWRAVELIDRIYASAR
ncbi:Gfo/Idh/MocA family protein [Micromonospora echinospora]|uniref:Gfo/Idh/MocA family protein n=1 Tax=Micromonospora echinospora TaxID=1877 RepID=UPI0037B06844